MFLTRNPYRLWSFQLGAQNMSKIGSFSENTLFCEIKLNRVFFVFLQFPSRELEQTCHFRMEAPKPRHSENDKIVNMLDHKVQELST